MCGIAGVLGLDGDAVDGMCDRLTYRGPDSSGTTAFPENDLRMGVRRLAIVDIEGGQQPITNESGSVAVVFNGEIYNHRELREELESAGHKFTTEVDTEVLVHLWEEYGQSMPEHLRGMFAFAIWDNDQEVLFLARDRFGIKPLYYANTDDGFAWASEIPALLESDFERRIDERALYKYFYLDYIHSPETLFANARKLSPGTAILVDGDEVTTSTYWQIERRSVDGSPAVMADRLRDLLEASVKRRLMADVPIGAFLSGGVDSSAIVALMNEHTEDPVKTFSLRFADAKHDESEEAQFVADHFGTDHVQVDVDLSSMDVFTDMVARYGDPLADTAALPTMLLAERAAADRKVVMSGEGADELFAGYRNRYLKLPRHRKYLGQFPAPIYRIAEAVAPIEQRIPWTKDYATYFADLDSDVDTFANWLRGFKTSPETYTNTPHDAASSGLLADVEQCFADAPRDDVVSKMLSYDIRYWLTDDLLYKVDHTTMNASLEARVPFLDHEFVTYAYNIPPEHKVGDGVEHKALLKRALSDILPERTLRREKHGLSVPKDQWFKTDEPAIATVFTEEKIGRAPYVSTDRVFELWDGHRRGESNNGAVLWKLLNYVAWHEEFVV